MSPSTIGKCKIAYFVTERQRSLGALKPMLWVTFSVLLEHVLPRTQHLFAKENVLADLQRSSRTGTNGKEETHHLYFFTPTAQNRNTM